MMVMLCPPLPQTPARAAKLSRSVPVAERLDALRQRLGAGRRGQEQQREQLPPAVLCIVASRLRVAR